MSKVYSWRFHVRTYELDETSYVRSMVYNNYLEEAAMQASASNGYDYDWYMAHDRVWIASKITLRYYSPARYRDELEMRTWVSQARMVQSHREYDLRRVSDGIRILRARTNWVYIDSVTHRPQRLPDMFMESFEPDGTLERLDMGIAEPIAVENPVPFSQERHVQPYEIDAAKIVNNGVYIGWCEQAIASTIRAWIPEQSDLKMTLVGRQIEYLRSAQMGAALQVVTRLAEIGRDRAAWRTEVRDVKNDELLARDYAVHAFADSGGPRSIPDALYFSLTASR